MANPSRDKTTLTVLLHATNGLKLFKKLNIRWREGLPLTSWEGVEVDSDGQVVSLRLPHNHLQVALVWSGTASSHSIFGDCGWEVDRYLPEARRMQGEYTVQCCICNQTDAAAKRGHNIVGNKCVSSSASHHMLKHRRAE